MLTVRSGALAYRSDHLTQLIVESGGNPAFEGTLFGSYTNTLTTINMGNAMTVANMAALLKSVGAFNKGTTIEAWGFSGDKDTGSTVWSGVTWDNVALVTLPAELIADQAFGSATVYGRFYINKELISFCTSATFYDLSGSNMQFYVADGIADDSRLNIQRVKYIAAGQGVLIHKTENSSGYADLERTESIEEAVYDNKQAIADKALYDKNMLVGVTTATQIGKTNGNGDKTNYVLKDGAFHPTSGGIIKANRAYLQIPASETAHDISLSIDFNKEETGIQSLSLPLDRGSNVKGQSSTVYDLQGRCIGKVKGQSSMLNAQCSGLYIKNGKKYVAR